MHITRVELENIKSYKHAVFQFRRGTTAITGENGAGKTTILEAIAWALFDILNYKKEDFVRRGAKRGQVRVRFESDVDGREYSVYRDTGTGYYVFDHGLNQKIAEKTVDVGAWLRMHLGIEPGTDLKALFKSAIGVPQGSFTADFLSAPNVRKASFDRLLKVEEYREGAERLRDTIKLIADKRTEVLVRIASNEGELARYDERLAEHKEVTARVEELGRTLDELKREIESRERVVSEMDSAEVALNDARSRAERLSVERDAALRRVEDVRAERDAAQSALERQRAAQADYETHIAAQEQLRELDAMRAARDKLRAEEKEVSLQLASATNNLQRLEDALARALDAAATIKSLEPEVREQEELERERERLRDLRAGVMSERERAAVLDRELDILRTQHAQIQRRIREAEAGTGAQERAEKLESERLEVETRLSVAEKNATSQEHLLRERKTAKAEVDRIRRSIAEGEREAARLEKLAARASEIEALASRESELTERLAHLRAEISRDEKFQREVKNGLCPILSERCLNLGEGETLETYFQDHLAANSMQLNKLERERAQVGLAVRDAREAEKHLSRLESVRKQLGQDHVLAVEREAALASLDREIAALKSEGKEQIKELRLQLFGIDGELKNVREAALKFAELQPLRERLEEIAKEGKEKKERRAEAAAASDALAELEKDFVKVEERLRALKDPRGRSASLLVEAERESGLRSEIERARDKESELVKQAQAIAYEMKQYAALDAQWEEARVKLDTTARAHQEYLTSKALADNLPARQQELDKAEEEARRAALEAERAREEFDRATAAYDRERHMAERAALVEATKHEARTSAQLSAEKEREANLSTEIARLSEIRERMREEFLERDRLERLNEATDFIRDVLREAGPRVTESYLYNVSIEANQLFREITGDAARSLKWSRDYEIILEEEGHERSFQNLSGGEQMAAALSVRLALLKQLSDIRMAFFDEPTVNMDQRRREGLAQQIGQIKHFDQLFVISHDDTFEEAVDQIIHVPDDGLVEQEAVA